ncbi:MAG: SDR family NAD(P)-dependent oxidoreductase [Chloroflexales bacterium]
MTDTSQPVVLLTGASIGLGRVTAEVLSASGFSVFGTSRTPKPDPSRPYAMLPLDVRSDESVAACVQAVLERTGRLDMLINNAGFGLTGAIEEASLDQAKGLFETNFFGAVRMVQAVLPLMREQRRGTIVNVSSIGGIVASPLRGFYSASKHALEGYTEALRHEVKPFGIHVALVEPGVFQSSFDAATQEPARPLGAYAALRQRAGAFFADQIATGADPRAIAHVILRILRDPNPRLRHLVGADARMLALSKRTQPEALLEAQIRWIFRLDNRPLPEGLMRAGMRLFGVGRNR